MSINDIINSGQEWAAERAQYALQISAVVKAGEMSASEGKELLADLVSTERLEESAANAELRSALVFAIGEIAAAMI
jgi:polyhydroxyalkanoate synthesis regulator phasin